MLKSLLLFFRNSFTTKTQLILENLFLTKQLEIYQRTDPKLKIKRTDRTFFSLMKDLLSNWKTFLKNHSKEIISIDFLTVPTINFKLVHILVVIEHYRRKLIYFNVTKNPTAEWSIQQIRNLLFDYDTPKYLIRDRDRKYGRLLDGRKNRFGINELVTAYRSPWQNGYVERVIGSIKRECLDHLIVMNEDHLRNILSDYISYYNKYRTHLGLNKDSPEDRPTEVTGKIDKIPMVNGLHHYYFRQAA